MSSHAGTSDDSESTLTTTMSFDSDTIMTNSDADTDVEVEEVERTVERKVGLNDLPAELITAILGFLPSSESVLTVTQTNRKFRGVLMENAHTIQMSMGDAFLPASDNTRARAVLHQQGYSAPGLPVNFDDFLRLSRTRAVIDYMGERFLRQNSMSRSYINTHHTREMYLHWYNILVTPEEQWFDENQILANLPVQLRDYHELQRRRLIRRIRKEPPQPQPEPEEVDPVLSDGEEYSPSVVSEDSDDDNM